MEGSQALQSTVIFRPAHLSLSRALGRDWACSHARRFGDSSSPKREQVRASRNLPATIGPMMSESAKLNSSTEGTFPLRLTTDNLKMNDE